MGNLIRNSQQLDLSSPSVELKQSRSGRKNDQDDEKVENANDDDGDDKSITFDEDEKRERLEIIGDEDANDAVHFVDRNPLETKLIEQALQKIYSNEDDLVEVELMSGEQATSSSAATKSQSKKQSSTTEGSLNYPTKPFLGQKIEEIRRNSGQQFVDPYFKPSIRLITESCRSEFFKSLCNSLRVNNKLDMSELSKRVLWKKSKVRR